MRRTLLLLAAAGAGGYAAYRTAFKPWHDAWGVEGDERTRPLPGDDVLPDGRNLDTRGITIDAPPEAVWPWIVQMGYGRAGWYSYDALDMRGESADRLLADVPPLAVGDVVPTDPEGGMEVRAIEPDRLLVLFIDAAARAREAAAQRQAAAPGVEATPANLEAAGAFMGAGMPPDFQATWSFVLEPLPGGRTRLLERMRGTFGEGAPWTSMTMPLMGLGVFVMLRRHLLGLRDRAEGDLLPGPESPLEAPVILPGG